jgi:prepilin-type N-terminal cleavage/methylation domain-containing protein
MAINNRAFTLTELLIVLAIISILVVISVPAYVGQQRSAARAEAYSNLQTLRLLGEQFFAENACYQPLAGGACPAGPTNYVSTANIQGFLPGFRPGAGTNFDYVIIVQNGFSLPNPAPVPYDFSTAPLANPNAPCFIAAATGLPGTRVDGDIFAIDCNNNRNF